MYTIYPIQGKTASDVQHGNDGEGQLLLAMLSFFLDSGGTTTSGIALSPKTVRSMYVASEASYWCNRRETSEIQAKAYSGSEALVCACGVYTQRCVCMCVAAVECETCIIIEFQGFCTLSGCVVYGSNAMAAY